MLQRKGRETEMAPNLRFLQCMWQQTSSAQCVNQGRSWQLFSASRHSWNRDGPAKKAAAWTRRSDSRTERRLQAAAVQAGVRY